MPKRHFKLDRLDTAQLAQNPRASLRAWEKYRPLVEAAISLHPKPYVYRPTNLSPSTVTSRIRDAIRGCLAFDYHCAYSRQEISAWFTDVAIKHDAEQVFIGPIESKISDLLGEQQRPQLYVYDSLSLDEVIAFTHLLSSNRLCGPVEVRNPPDISLLPELPNVEIIRREDGSLILL